MTDRSLTGPSAYIIITLSLASGVFVVGAAELSGAMPGVMQLSQKASRTPEQRKIDSRLLLEIDRRRGGQAAKNLPPDDTGVKIDKKSRALVDVRADVTPDLEMKLRAMDGTIVSTSVEYHTTIVWFPVLKLEQLAKDSSVVAIVPAAEAIKHR